MAKISIYLTRRLRNILACIGVVVVFIMTIFVIIWRPKAIPISRDHATMQFAHLARDVSTFGYHELDYRSHEARGVTRQRSSFNWRVGISQKDEPVYRDDSTGFWENNSLTVPLIGSDFDNRVHAYWALTDGLLDIDQRVARIQAVVGPDTAYAYYHEHGRMPRGNPEIADAITCIEISHPILHWTQQEDFDVRKLHQVRRSGMPSDAFSGFYDGFHVAFVDGEVWFLAKNTPWQAILPFFTLSAAEMDNREVTLKEYVVVRALHPF